MDSIGKNGGNFGLGKGPFALGKGPFSGPAERLGKPLQFMLKESRLNTIGHHLTTDMHILVVGIRP